MTHQEDRRAENTDLEIWRERPGDFYADSIHVTEGGGIGINCGGHVFVRPLREWHKMAADPTAYADVVLSEENDRLIDEIERLRADNTALRGAIDTILTAAKAARELTDHEQRPGN